MGLCLHRFRWEGERPPQRHRLWRQAHIGANSAGGQHVRARRARERAEATSKSNLRNYNLVDACIFVMRSLSRVISATELVILTDNVLISFNQAAPSFFARNGPKSALQWKRLIVVGLRPPKLACFPWVPRPVDTPPSILWNMSHIGNGICMKINMHARGTLIIHACATLIISVCIMSMAHGCTAIILRTYTWVACTVFTVRACVRNSNACVHYDHSTCMYMIIPYRKGLGRKNNKVERAVPPQTPLLPWFGRPKTTKETVCYFWSFQF